MLVSYLTVLQDLVIKQEIEGGDVSVVFDGATRLGDQAGNRGERC